jgi:hypothetical protein
LRAGGTKEKKNIMLVDESELSGVSIQVVRIFLKYQSAFGGIQLKLK